MKRCRKCGVEKALDDFDSAKGARDGRRGDCKSCFQARAKARYPAVREQAIARATKWREENPERFRANQQRRRSMPEAKRRARDYHLQRNFGISVDQYDELLRAQSGRCAICHSKPTPGISLHVDHDHETGSNRGLLCFRCNNALGDLGDDMDRLRVAGEYLIRHDPAMQEMAEVAKARLRALKAT